MTYEELRKFAAKYDGNCKVYLDEDSCPVLMSPHQTAPRPTWDYFFSDEAENFNYARFGITPPECQCHRAAGTPATPWCPIHGDER